MHLFNSLPRRVSGVLNVLFFIQPRKSKKYATRMRTQLDLPVKPIFLVTLPTLWLLECIDRQRKSRESEFLSFRSGNSIFFASFVPVIHRSTYLLSSKRTKREREGERERGKERHERSYERILARQRVLSVCIFLLEF